MNLDDLEFCPEYHLPFASTLYRVQRQRANRQSVVISGVRLPPTGLLSGRFDLPERPVGHFAEAPDTALYESLARREATSVSLVTLGARELFCASTRLDLRLLDLRPHATTWPVLQSLRFSVTQALARSVQAEGYEGIVYRSAQQHARDCFALFEPALRSGLRPVFRQALVERRSGSLHRTVIDVLRGAQLPLLG